MAGSMKQMVYTSDATRVGLDAQGANVTSNRKYVVTVDESNGEATGFDDYTGQDDNDIEPMPKGLEMRYILCQYKEGNASVQRRLPVGKPDNELFTDGGSINLLVAKTGTSGESEAFQITYASGEKRSFLKNPQNGGSGGTQGGEDTGLIDGDET